jgi:hypothetical protein
VQSFWLYGLPDCLFGVSGAVKLKHKANVPCLGEKAAVFGAGETSAVLTVRRSRCGVGDSE